MTLASAPGPTSPPSLSEDARTTTTSTSNTTPALQRDAEDATPLTDQEVHDITAYIAAAAKNPSAATAATSAAAASTATATATATAAAGVTNDDDAENGALTLGDDDFQEVTNYWDAAAMAPLNAMSAAAIARLRRYIPPPFPLWDRLPVSRRAAVLILLYADRRGDLRVVITMRAASLRSFSGHAAFPGGKADTMQETPYEIARREAWEEIGLPMDDARIPKPFKIEPLCYLPYNLARTELVVRPCVAFLHADEEPDEHPSPLVEERMIPRLDAKEVAAVFSAPFQNFLRARDPEQQQHQQQQGKNKTLPPGHWYDGNWIQWKDHPWRVHNFYVPVDDQRVTTPGNAMEADHPQSNLAEKLEEEGERGGRFKVWGLTAHMLVDAARIAYGKDPEFECNPHFGDEEIILEAEREGSLVDKKRQRDEAPTSAAEGKSEKAEPAKM